MTSNEENDIFVLDIPVNRLLNRSNMKAASKILHCTLKFIGPSNDRSRKEYTDYAGNRLVSHLIGKMCRGFIIGFVITPRTLGKILFYRFVFIQTWTFRCTSFLSRSTYMGALESR